MEWITDRRPTIADGSYVFDRRGFVVHHLCVLTGEPWMRIERPAPYVKPWTVRWREDFHCWMLYNRENVCMTLRGFNSNDDEHRKAAERIAAIYEELMP